MWLNFFFLIVASLCVGFILGWVVGRPRRWVVFGPDDPNTPDGEDQAGLNSFARRA
jgi:hypothetical protein